MKKNYVLGIATLSAVVLLAGCGNKELTPTEYCEQNGGASSEGVCLFEDGSYCAEEAYANGECQAGDIVYNTVEEEVTQEENFEEEIAEEVELVGEEVVNEAEEVVDEAEEVVDEVVEEVTEEIAE